MCGLYRSDMKAIMAEAEAATKSPSSAGIQGTFGLPQRHAYIVTSHLHKVIALKSPSKLGSLRKSDDQFVHPPTSSLLISRSSGCSLPPTSSNTPRQTQVSQNTPTRTGLGPIITPKWQYQTQSDPKTRSTCGRRVSLNFCLSN